MLTIYVKYEKPTLKRRGALKFNLSNTYSATLFLSAAFRTEETFWITGEMSSSPLYLFFSTQA